MLSGRLRRRALALLGALLLVILIWPPCCATMPKPLPAVLPPVPQIDLDPIPAVAIVVQNQHQHQNNKSRKVSDLSRFMNVLLMRPVDSGESGPRAESTHDDDDSQRTLNLPRRENSSAGYPIESSIDKNKSNEQQTATAVTKRLDNAVTTFGGSDPAVESGSTYQPAITNIFSILSQRASATATTRPSSGVDLQVNDRGGGGDGVVVTAVNQSVFNPTSKPPTSSSSTTPRRHHPFFPVLSRAERSADGQHHQHRHQHHYQTGEGTLAATGGGGRRLRHQNHRNGTTPMAGGPDAGGGDTSNLERNERSANLSHITGANRKIQLYIKNRYLQLLADGTVNGTHDDQSEFTILQRTTVAAGQIRIQGVATCLFLCMDTCGTVYGSRDFTDDCVFNEQMEQHHYNTYSSTRHSNARRTLYLALNKTGQPRKIQIPVNRTLGKLATYTKALTQTVAHDRVERLISRLFGANHVRHGLKQLCETGVLPEVEMRTRPACGGGQGVAKPAGLNKSPAAAAAGGANKDKDSKDTLRKKKKKRRKCREDETPGEHCFRPAASASSSGSSLVGTNSNRRRLATPPGQAKSQQLRCGGDEGECVDSPSSSSPNNSANSVSSSNSNRASTTVPNDGGGPKKKVAKKVNHRNAPPNVNSKKPKGGGGGPGGPGGGGPKKAKQQTSISSSTVPLAAKGKVKAMTSPRTTPRTTTARSTTTTTPSPTPSSSTTPFNLDDTSQSEDEELAALDMDELAALHQLSSAEIIEEDELDEVFSSINCTKHPPLPPQIS
ncbi:uncharacterized protein LOC6054177 isoform X2 [Culex quinquefasciatus]|uniref:uncharacterized protein LOC6054177 isoform X2 n=1 Tax=Culex quinquefasciatus TaxID=7176 RepID=UPI0018E3BFA5|nr:uncharacterized protein LOC6054177 isoform X2 [Culex quinquefasciatus]